MKKDIEKREDLIGREILYEDKLILISEARERTFDNPNVKEWHGRKTLQSFRLPSSSGEGTGGDQREIY